jgi:fructose 1,6-bisphosphatase
VPLVRTVAFKIADHLSVVSNHFDTLIEVAISNMTENNNKQTKVQISLYASKLKNVAGTFKGKSDPYAVVTLLAGSPLEKPRVIGKTEV